MKALEFAKELGFTRIIIIEGDALGLGVVIHVINSRLPDMFVIGNYVEEAK